jgi:hypothetical protein
MGVEHINHFDDWKIKIEDEIKKTDVFVILYSHIADKKERYILDELTSIKDEIKEKQKKFIIIIFPQITKLSDLQESRPFFSGQNVIQATPNRYFENGNDQHWIGNVTKNIEKLRKDEKCDRWGKLALRAVASILLLALVLIIFKKYDIGHELHNINIFGSNAKTTCELLSNKVFRQI